MTLGITQGIFLGLVALLIAQRLVEMAISRRNEARIIAAGGREHAPGQFKVMALLHTAWFVAMVVEVLLDHPRTGAPFLPWLAGVALGVTLLGQTLRYLAITTLGWRWSVRVMTVPEAPVVAGGVYRFIRHPNYLGVILEIAAVPLLHGAWITATSFTIANGLLLFWRIRTEERALAEANDYADAFADRGRLLPVGGVAEARPDARPETIEAVETR